MLYTDLGLVILYRYQRKTIFINVISKVFEHCVSTKFRKFFDTSSNQFGFKTKSSCAQTIYSLRKVVQHCHYVSGGSTVNVCLLDLSKPFDKMNHFALYTKLMNRSIPSKYLV